MEEFTYYTGTESFIDAIKSCLDGLPILGDPSPSTIISLAHYSDNAEINLFKKSYDFNWTRKVTDNVESLRHVIGYSSDGFRALYILKLGIGNSYRPRDHDSSLMEEYAIDLEISRANIGLVKLDYIAGESRYAVSY